ncbi:hypothetical protein LEP1GSC133_3644 [Leptospira borgpetersenii serovar Pomona str. 200901868]|uniref:Uncharacterized protein n=1 Tax=Leptospira borgpetersenii serovar Pomona str. 200901868 TaxID=1192866 RepID=M6WJZ3_LEPBO|nr:hypothetical protein LEP1GSC133_3644 [Leptospira borgpetersenii serovar Pomona str. 200901868]
MSSYHFTFLYETPVFRTPLATFGVLSALHVSEYKIYHF